MTCIIGGKCSEGVVLISDSKITYDDHPPDNTTKLHREFHPIITGGAGSTDLYDIFMGNIVQVMQSGAVIPDSFPSQPIRSASPVVQTSGVIHLYAPGSAGGYNHGAIQNRFSTLVKRIQATGRRGNLEVLTATQLEDVREAKLTHITDIGASDVYHYKSIGDGEQFSYVFLKPFYDTASTKSMYNVIRLGYFVIKFLDRFELSTGIGCPPQFWGIPNYGSSFTHDDKKDWVAKFENDTDVMMEKFKQILSF
jgi:hypothetical protein